MLGQREQLAGDDTDHLRSVVLITVLNYVLGHIVAVLVRDQELGAAVDLFHDHRLVGIGAMLQDPLDDPATVGMGRELADASPEAVHDEVDVLARHQLDDLLDHVVPVLVLDDSQYIGLQLLDQLCLLLDECMLQYLLQKHVSRTRERGGISYDLVGRWYLSYLLNNSAGVHLDGQVCKLPLHDACQHLLLNLATMLEELLDDIIAKDVLHELNSVRLNLSEDSVLLVAVRCLELLLDESRALLISAKFDDVVVDVLARERKKISV